MAQLPRSPLERRAESFGQRRLRHVDKDPRFHRFAGDLFGIDMRDRERNQARATKSRLQGSRPVGVGFGENDNYGPDNSWDTKDPIKDTLVPGYYTNQRTF